MLTPTVSSIFSPKTPSFDEKISLIKKIFEDKENSTEKYSYLIDLGRKLPSIDPMYKTEEFLVHGCQSLLYIHAEKKDGFIFFSAHSDSLISSGLAGLLIYAYGGEKLETILSHPPHFLLDLGIYASLSPNRAQGIGNIFRKMKILAALLTR